VRKVKSQGFTFFCPYLSKVYIFTKARTGTGAPGWTGGGENLLISERIKQLRYKGKTVQRYFWRTKQQQEVDYVEEQDGKVSGFEFKWSSKRRIRFPKTFSENYKAQVHGITRENFRDYKKMKLQNKFPPTSVYSLLPFLK